MDSIAISRNYSIYQLLFFVLVASALCFSIGAFPSSASADVISTQTQQILPPGGNACAAVSATGFTPYVYNGALHSFEFTLPDSSYVAVAGSIGNTSLPFQLMTRRTDGSGAVRIHVDVATTPLSGTLPLKVTLLSARPGQPVCATVVSMSVGSGPVVSQYTPPATYSVPATSSNVPTSSSAPGSQAATTQGSMGGKVSSSTTGQQMATSATSTTTAAVAGAMQNPLKSICGSETGAYRLWLILLVLYAIVVGLALWAEFPMSLSWARTPERIATIILVLLLALLAFWYFSVSCRAALWMPLVAFLIAVLGLLAAFWNHPRVTQLLLVQEQKKP